MNKNRRIALLIGLAIVAIASASLIPPIHQAQAYHDFADRRTILGIPNFWNVVSNTPFLLVAIWGFFRMGRFADPWERRAHILLLAALAQVSFGSGYYHLHPNDATLLWDRLPMTVVFMTLLSITVGERIDSRTGGLLLVPLIVTGFASLLIWTATGDLRAYGLVQFYPMLALPLMLVLFPARYSGSAGVWAMIACYGGAKLLEFSDRWIWNIAEPVSGHPWKHLAGALAMLCYVEGIQRRDTLVTNSRVPSYASQQVDRKSDRVIAAGRS